MVSAVPQHLFLYMETATDPNLLYLPPPDIDPNFQAQFDAIVPEAPCGGGVKCLRYVWGVDRLEYVAGYWSPRYGDTMNDPPKYIGRPSFILEGWQSPDVFNEAEWRDAEHLLGEWPRNGYWDFIEYHVDADDKYLSLDNSALDRVRNWKHWKSKGHQRSLEELMQFRMLRLSQQEKRKEEAAKAVAQNFSEQFIKAWENNPQAEYSLPPLTNGFKRTESGILIKG